MEPPGIYRISHLWTLLGVVYVPQFFYCYVGETTTEASLGKQGGR